MYNSYSNAVICARIQTINIFNKKKRFAIQFYLRKREFGMLSNTCPSITNFYRSNFCQTSFDCFLFCNIKYTKKIVFYTNYNYNQQYSIQIGTICTWCNITEEINYDHLYLCSWKIYYTIR